MSGPTKKLVSIPIGRRIGEILEERGSAFSIRAFSTRIGFSKDMLSRMISGDRYISPSELSKIAEGLSLSIARLKQEDTQEQLSELMLLLENKKNNQRALSIALKIKEVAVGCTERYIVTNELGKAYHALRMYNESHAEWLEAREYAQRIVDKYQDTEPLYNVMNNLVLSFTEQKDIFGLSALVGQLKQVFTPYPKRLGTLYYSTASTAFFMGNYREARDNYLLALAQFELHGDSIYIGKSEHNVGFAEYKLENYRRAKEHFERAIEKLSEYDEQKLISMKDYIKTLLKLGQKQRAAENISSALQQLELLDLPLRKAQFLLLHAIVHEDLSAAEQVLAAEGIPVSLKLTACKFLMDFYKCIGDAENLMRYYVIADSYESEKFAIYDGMGL